MVSEILSQQLDATRVDIDALSVRSQKKTDELVTDLSHKSESMVIATCEPPCHDTMDTMNHTGTTVFLFNGLHRVKNGAEQANPEQAQIHIRITGREVSSIIDEILSHPALVDRLTARNLAKKAPCLQ